MNLLAGAAESSSATTRMLDLQWARAAAQSTTQLHPPTSSLEPMPPCQPSSNSHHNLPLCCLCRCLSTPCRSSCHRHNATGGPPPLLSFPNSSGMTCGSAPRSSASWVREDTRLLSPPPPSRPTPMFICALSLLLSSRRQPPSHCRSQGPQPPLSCDICLLEDHS